MTTAYAGIDDRAGMFSDDAVARARKTIDAIEAKHRHGVRIETHETVPDDKADAVAKMSRSERDQFFGKWLRERAKYQHAEGLFVLITKQPAHIHVGASTSLQRAGFSAEQRQDIVRKFTDAFKAQDFDRGLQDGLAAVDRSFRELSPQPATRSMPIAPPKRDQQTGWSLSGLLMMVAIVVGALLLLSFLGRAMSGGGAGPGSQGGGYGGGGGGWLGSLFAGLGGAFLGNWLYDSFSGGHHAAHADEPHHGAGGVTDPNADEDWASAGADWGGDGASADGGGGDFGDTGGDW